MYSSYTCLIKNIIIHYYRYNVVLVIYDIGVNFSFVAFENDNIISVLCKN